MAVSTAPYPQHAPAKQGVLDRRHLRAQTLGEDRILDKGRATGGDVRSICELFGLSVEGALRYTSTLDHTDIRP